MNDTTIGNYSALTDQHCLYTQSDAFRSYFSKVVGPYSLAAALSVRPNLNLDYSKPSVRRRVVGEKRKPGTVWSSQITSQRPSPILGGKKIMGAMRPRTAPTVGRKGIGTGNSKGRGYSKGGFVAVPRQGALGKPLDMALSPLEVKDLRKKNSGGGALSFSFAPPTLLEEPQRESRGVEASGRGNTLSLYLSGRVALLGEYKIVFPNETLLDLRRYARFFFFFLVTSRRGCFVCESLCDTYPSNAQARLTQSYSR